MIQAVPQRYIRKFVLEQLSNPWFCPQHHPDFITSKPNKYLLKQRSDETIL